ncbi:MAG: DUF6660 family protein, partial [Chitinophagales bacterium]
STERQYPGLECVPLFTFATMKPIVLILSFLLIGLSVWPCGDEDLRGETGTIESKMSDRQSQHEDHDDGCSPFCHCTCCAGYSINHIFITTTSLIQANTLIYSSYLAGNLIEYPSAIWQPPKIG